MYLSDISDLTFIHILSSVVYFLLRNKVAQVNPEAAVNVCLRQGLVYVHCPSWLGL